MIIKKNSQKLREKKRHIEEVAVKSDTSVQNSSAQNFSAAPEQVSQELNMNSEAKAALQKNELDVDLFDIENIDFTQRQERRRGSRRRGYRRIDDRNLVSRAQEEAENIKKSAFEEGYKQGLEAAKEDIETFHNRLSNFMGATKEVYEYIAPDILEISVDIARKIIKKEVESDPQVLISIIIDVLKTVSKNEPKINIRVKPQAVQFIKDSIPDLTYQYGIESKINIVSDPSIEDGGCVFQTSNGIVDASIDTQIEIIKKALEGMSS